MYIYYIYIYNMYITIYTFIFTYVHNISYQEHGTRLLVIIQQAPTVQEGRVLIMLAHGSLGSVGLP